MSEEYLDKLGLERVAEYVNNKVAKVLTLPSDATEGLVVLYVGGTSATAIQGHIYKAQEGSWVDITPPTNTFNDEDFSVGAQNEVSLLPAWRVYHGTRAAWDLLSVAEKTQYGATAFTDDEGGAYVDTYSTNEVKTNKVWIDNKPVYRKVLVVNQTISSDTTISSTIPDGVSDYWINYGESYFEASTTLARLPLSYAHPSAQSAQISAWLSDKDTITIRVGASQSVSKMVAVLEYTKTAD